MGENNNSKVYSTGERLAKLEQKVYELRDDIRDLKDNHIEHLRGQIEGLQKQMVNLIVQTYQRPHWVVTLIIGTLSAIIGYMGAIIKFGG